MTFNANIRPLRKSALLGGVAFAALAWGQAAQAFDTVDWTWTSVVDSTVTTDVTVTVDVEATGLTQVENEQMSMGDLSSTSTVTDVLNEPVAGVNGLTVDDLARVESAATSVGNNASIDSDVMTQVNSIQSVSGVGTPAVVDPVLGTEIAPAVMAPATITASSTVTAMTNVAVDSAATGVGNNLSVTLEAATPGDAILIANNVQDSFANITATSSVSDVTVTDFAGLGAMEGPLVSSAATAVGNNLSISVSGPTAP